MSEIGNKRTYEYDEELENVTGDELLHTDKIGWVQAKKITLTAIYNWLKTSFTGFFIRSINGAYPDENSNIAITASNIGAGTAQQVESNRTAILARVQERTYTISSAEQLEDFSVTITHDLGIDAKVSSQMRYVSDGTKVIPNREYSVAGTQNYTIEFISVLDESIEVTLMGVANV